MRRNKYRLIPPYRTSLPLRRGTDASYEAAQHAYDEGVERDLERYEGDRYEEEDQR